MDNQRIKPAPKYDVFGRTIKSQPVKPPVTPVVRPVVSKPVVEQPKTNPTIVKEPAVEPVRRPAKKPISKMVWYIVGGVITAVVVAVIVVVVLKNLPKTGPDDTSVNYSDSITEEEREITKKTIDEYVDLTVEGYQHVENEDGVFDAVVVKVKNKGNDTTSLAIELVAKDAGGNVLDESSLYAEGIEPGQTQVFYNFVFSELTKEQLESAKYEIYKAHTYDANAIRGEE